MTVKFSPTISRRTVTTGAAWAVPAVMAAATAPAFQASRPCTYTVSAWQTRVSDLGATAQNQIRATTVANGGTRFGTAYTNMAISPNIDGAGVYSDANWLQLGQGGNNLRGQTVTITFPQEVYCVEFYVNDIDTQWVRSIASTYRDTVTVAPGFTATTASPYVTVSGGMAQATNTASSANPDTWSWDHTDSANGLAKFTAAGPITSLTLEYTNPAARTTATGVNNNNQQVWVSPLKYSTAPCAC